MTDLTDMIPLAKTIGVELKHATPEQVIGELSVRPELCTAGGILHGGAIMAFADTLGAVGAYLALPQGAVGTTTIESKTTLSARPVGARIKGEASLLPGWHERLETRIRAKTAS